MPIDTHSGISTSTPATSEMSTTSTSTSPSVHAEKVPDFTEFRLDPFHLTADAGTPSPHRLREARRSFALYLEPEENSKLAYSLKQFFEQTFSQFGPNQAHNAAPHVSILGRVHIERGSGLLSKWTSVDTFMKAVDHHVNTTELQPPTFGGFEIASSGLFLRVRMDPAYGQIAKGIERDVASQCAAFDIRPMDRIHLAYNVLHPLSKAHLKRMRDVARDTIRVEDMVDHTCSWKLTLYEIMLESRVVGAQQQVTPLKTWPIRSPSQGSSILPVSVRIKLAVLSSWLRWSYPSVQHVVDPNKRIEEKAHHHHQQQAQKS
ncbi:hypothetical protein BCR43DRAFT_496975 [Syncephalastrum racemosum]|uniref:Uncharacterized protein n=1 Tax=Syncephalastrum racemosum TaxID=13706 RepID=A0A1X2H574_SYNRA|nr:hypothetical protein BCR43DRAFT_496975 [Syncephalastrum racemosum]